MRPAISARRSNGRVTLDGVNTLMLGSNDYLGLSTDPRIMAATAVALERYGTGTCLYPVFATTSLHDELCSALASFLRVEAVALFSSGGAANAGVLTTLVEAGDVIVSDHLNHASIIDGCRLSRAEVVPFKNRDVDDLRAALARTRTAHRRLVVTDGIFSMEGAAAPLREIYALAREHDALLVVDEAHALGVVGPDGTGTAPLLGLANGSPGLVLTGSLSKAIGGASGGFVAGSHAVIEQLQAYCRGWIFTMGMTTANAATAMAALNVCRTDLSLRERLWANLSHVHDALRACGVPCFASDSAIIALRIGDEERASRVSAALRHDCVYAPAVGYPIVGRGEARLRLQISAAHEVADLDRAVAAIAVLINGSRQ
jgi:8-amino-7-oxononanoate synthase